MRRTSQQRSGRIELHEGVQISTYEKTNGFSKCKAHGYQRVKAKTFTEEEMRKSGFETVDSEWLVVKQSELISNSAACILSSIFLLGYSIIFIGCYCFQADRCM